MVLRAQMLPGLSPYAARFSDCRTWRYLLHPAPLEQPVLVWLLCNPSDADELAPDPTIRKVTGFTRRLGFGSWLVANLFGLVSSDPKALREHPEPVGPDNDEVLRSLPDAPIVLGWGGVGGVCGDRVCQVLSLLGNRDLRCLGRTSDGHPRHPGRLSYQTPLEKWAA